MVHAVWGTKNRFPFLSKGIRTDVINHIKSNAALKQIFIDELNGHNDHLHCLFKLNADLSISKTLQLIKGESSFWINKQSLTRSKFEWADEYYAASVSESKLEAARTYIRNQEQHHAKTSFQSEYEAFLKGYGFSGTEFPFQQ
jgi:REP element-mobilizing transposase RayT